MSWGKPTLRAGALESKEGQEEQQCPGVWEVGPSGDQSSGREQRWESSEGPECPSRPSPLLPSRPGFQSLSNQTDQWIN